MGSGKADVDLSEGQLRILAATIHAREMEQLHKLKFNSYADQQKYLRECTEARDKVINILNGVSTMKSEAEEGRDPTKQAIAADVYSYCTKSIGQSLKFIRSYNTRFAYLGKLQAHSESLIQQLRWLDPATQMKEAQRLALEAGMYKKAALENAERFQHFVNNQFAKWLKDTGMSFEDLVQHYMAKLKLNGPFKNLTDIQKLKVYEKIIEAAGKGRVVVTYTFEALGGLGVALLVFTAGVMVWDIYSSPNKVETTVRDSVSALTAIVSMKAADVAAAAIRAGFVALDLEISSAIITVIGAVVGIGIGVIIGAAAGALLDLIFSSGSSKVDYTDEHAVCRVAHMPNGLELARLVKYNNPDA